MQQQQQQQQREEFKLFLIKLNNNKLICFPHN
jgi:hypothetical protein